MTTKQEAVPRLFPESGPFSSEEADASTTLLSSLTRREAPDNSVTLADRIWTAVTRAVAESKSNASPHTRGHKTRGNSRR
jgi:hypothetical protein